MAKIDNNTCCSISEGCHPDQRYFIIVLVIISVIIIVTVVVIVLGVQKYKHRKVLKKQHVMESFS